jgi:hypothetical protein
MKIGPQGAYTGAWPATAASSAGRCSIPVPLRRLRLAGGGRTRQRHHDDTWIGPGAVLDRCIVDKAS